VNVACLLTCYSSPAASPHRRRYNGLVWKGREDTGTADAHMSSSSAAAAANDDVSVSGTASSSGAAGPGDGGSSSSSVGERSRRSKGGGGPRKEPTPQELQEAAQQAERDRRDEAIRRLPTIAYTGGFAGHCCLQVLDLRGADDLSCEGALYVLSRCLALNDVKMPFGSEFDESKYERKVPRQDLRGQPFWRFVFRNKAYAAAPPAEFEGAAPMTGYARLALEFRDCYTRRVLLEASCARFIQRVYYLYRWYNVHRRYNLAIRICRFLLVQRERRRWWKEFNKFKTNHSAKTIQKYFRLNFLPFSRATLLLQRLTRGWFGRRIVANIRRLHMMATRIQKISRGMLVRISDRYILAQIYMKLPPFWKSVVQTAPQKVNELSLSYSQLTEARQLVGDMKARIEQSFEQRGKSIMSVPHKYVQQSFDQAPYVSTMDGRKIAFFSHTNDGILTKRNQEDPFAAEGGGGAAAGLPPKPVHPFNIKFWPLVKPADVEGTDFSDENPLHQNPFEAMGNYQVSLHCEQCAKRLQMIFCKTCSRGMCFVCAFR
jgi:hypothetical protein